MQSKTGLILPGLFRGNEPQEIFLQSSEEPLFRIEHELETFIEKLTLPFQPLNRGEYLGVWLDWLFYALGGENYLRAEFSTTKKKAILQRLFEIYRSKGTVRGLRLNWEMLSETPLLKANQPPSKSYNAVSLTADDRQAWEANHPEIRIYPFAERGLRGYALMPKDYIGRGYAMTTDAGLRLSDRVELYDPQRGIKSLLNGFYYDKNYVKKKAKEQVEIRKKGQAKGVFAGSLSTRKHTVTHEAGKRLYNIELYQEYADEMQRRRWFAIQPSLSPMKGYYENEYVRGKRAGINLQNRYSANNPPSPFDKGELYKDKGGSYLSGAYFAESDARQRVRRKMKLFDPERAAFFRRETFNYLNQMQLGALSAHHIETFVDMTSKVAVRAAHLAGHLGDCLYQSDAGKRIGMMRWAGNLSRQAGCKVTVSITNRIPLITTMGTMCGKHITGQYIRRV